MAERHRPLGPVACDFVSDTSNPQIVIGLYSFASNGAATLQSINNSGDNGTYRAGTSVASYALSAGTFSGLAAVDLVTDGPNGGVFLLNPSDGMPLDSFPTLSILPSGVRLAGN